MRIQLLSDLHLESHPYELKPSKHADVLVLAGDIAPLTQRERLQKLLKQTGSKPTVMVTGNHEYYGSGFDHVDYQLGLILEQFPHVVLLNNSYATVAGMLFAGGTLWTDFCLPMKFKDGTRSDPVLAARAACEQISDFRTIRGARPETMYAENQECRIAIANAKALARPMVVVTHFLPSPKSIHARYEGDVCNPYFCSDCEDLMGDNVQAWLHGHTHCSAAYEVKGTQVVCNPRGYTAKENPAFSDECLIEVNP